jgi:hypothetical protein
VVTATLLGVLGWKISRHPPTWPQLKTAWLYPPKPVPPVADANGHSTSALPGAPSADGIRDGSEQAGVLHQSTAKKSDKAKEDAEPLAQISWPYRMPEVAQQPRLTGTEEANKEQTRAAETAGKTLLKQYRPDSIEGMLAVHVPTATGFGVMLYDGRAAKVVDRRVFMFGYVPLNRAWLELGGKRAIYLGDN